MNDVNLEGWKSVQIGRGSRESLELAVTLMVAGDEEFAREFWISPAREAIGNWPTRRSFSFRVGSSENPCFFWPGGRAFTMRFSRLEARLLALRDFFELSLRPDSAEIDVAAGEAAHALIYLPSSHPSAHEKLEMMLELKKRLQGEFPSDEIAFLLELIAPQS